jgi:hypothetical protein
MTGSLLQCRSEGDPHVGLVLVIGDPPVLPLPDL